MAGEEREDIADKAKDNDRGIALNKQSYFALIKTRANDGGDNASVSILQLSGKEKPPKSLKF